MLSSTSRLLRFLLAAALFAGCSLAQAQRVCTTNVNNGTWTTAANWNCTGGTNNGPPVTTVDSAVIAHSGFTYDDTGVTVTALTVNNGGQLIFTTGANRTLTVSGNTSVVAGGQVDVANDAPNRTHTLDMQGDLANAGDIDGDTNNDVLILRFSKTTGSAPIVQNVTGAGTWTFAGNGGIVIDMGSDKLTDYVDWQASDASAVPGSDDVTLTKGTFKYNVNRAYTPFSADPVIPAAAGFWVANGTVTFTAATWTSDGLTRISGGTFTIGNAANERLLAGAGGYVDVQGGALNVAGRVLAASAGTNQAWTFSMSGGTLTVPVNGNTSSMAPCPCYTFQMDGAAQTFIMTGGTLVIRNSDTTSSLAYQNLAATGNNVTGGTLQIGDTATPSGRTFNINATAPIGSLAVNRTTQAKTARLLTNSLTVLHNVTINGFGGGFGSTLTANNLDITLGTSASSASSTWTNNGIFTAGTGSVTFAGPTTQVIAGGSQTTFNNLSLNKPAGGANVTVLTVNTNSLALSPVVSGTLNFTAGTIDTRTNSRTLMVNSAAAVTGTLDNSRHVNGCVRKNYSNVATGFTFPTGDGTWYAPVTQTFAVNSGLASDVTACVTFGDHPQVTTPLASTGINKDLSVNRYWTLTSNTNPTNAFSLTFVYQNNTAPYETVDNDVGTTHAAYGIQRYSAATAWAPVAVSGTPTSTTASTTTSLTSGAGTLPGYGYDYAIGELLNGFANTIPGRFNAFEVGTTTLLGKLYTKQSGVAGQNIDLVAVNSSRTAIDSSYVGTAKVWFIDAADDSGAMDANGCRSSWLFRGSATPVSPMPGLPPAADINPTAAFAAGRRTVGVGTGAGGGTALTNAYPKMRVMIQDSASSALIGCSNDAFALRPVDVRLEAYDTDYQSASVGSTRPLFNDSGAIANSGNNVHVASTSAAGKPFFLTLRGRGSGGATTANYNATLGGTLFAAPVQKTAPACTNPSMGFGCATGTLQVGTWVAGGSGTIGAPAYYSEAGSFTYELEDRKFADVDSQDGASSYIIAQSPALREIGRFVPDRFVVSANNAPTFSTTCGSFSYIGQSFTYSATRPIALVNPVNAGGGTTSNYRGTLWNITTTAPSDVTVTYSNAVGEPTLDTALAYPAATANTPAIDTSARTITLHADDKFAYVRDTSAPRAPFDAAIAVKVRVRDDSEASVPNNPAEIITNTTPTDDAASFSMGFGGGASMRYGRLRLSNAIGAETIPLRVPVQTQYWTGTGFVTNTADNCTTLDRNNIVLGGYRAPLNACETRVVQNPVAFVSGVGTLTLAAPGTGNAGSVLVTPQLGVTASGNFCDTVGGAEAVTTAAAKSYLQGNWGAGTYDQNPSARASFGVYGSQPNNYIFFREIY